MPKIELTDYDSIAKQFLLLSGDSKDVLKDLPDNLIHTVVTSPPYWQLRDYFADDQLGQEATPEEYVKNLVDILKEVKRVLRKDGTLWLNIGDGYNNSSGFERTTDWKRKGRKGGSSDKKAFKHKSIKTKDLVGIPWRVAFALQEDGWYLRCDIIWEKTNPMPDGVKDRPTREHEYVFLLTKSPRYYYDYYRILEDTNAQPEQIQGFGANEQHGTYRMDQERSFEHYGKRNKRSVWRTSVSTFKGKHFATYPSKLIDPMIAASTSEKGCCVECGTPWYRIFEKEKIICEEVWTGETDAITGKGITDTESKKGYILKLVDKGWEKGCDCDTNDVKPGIVLDPFNGSGTTGIVSFKYDQKYIGIDTNQEYLDIARDNIMGGKKQNEHTILMEEVSTIEEMI
jgi:DNA modification methylase